MMQKCTRAKKPHHRQAKNVFLLKLMPLLVIAGQSKSHYTRSTSENASAVLLQEPQYQKEANLHFQVITFSYENPHYTLRKMQRTVPIKNFTSIFLSIWWRTSDAPITQHPHLSLSLNNASPAKEIVVSWKANRVHCCAHADLSFACCNIFPFQPNERNFPVRGISE